ncbi:MULTISPECIES: hypothetical protein [unclassified Clostridium]|uniref:hypothetical protein n=1 Tax=unclassified Clostridium TaxID=2614128 RepID=UPI0013E964AD|nr:MULTISPECIES: hypothetical protein [unclassified Clostridium]MBZ9625046.1 hypothetical protein [Clostridium sp. FP2]MBZ9636478.1 hypothetical protein [Clostridium sp. FP1]
MKQKIRVNLLGFYDFILALGAISIGVSMISSSKGILTEYPKEWLSKVPFESWVIPGIIAIVLFGLGNIIATISCFRRKNSKSWFVSAIMGGIFFLSIVAQIIILGEFYLATVEFLILSAIQLCLCGYVFVGYRKNLMRANI